MNINNEAAKSNNHERNYTKQAIKNNHKNHDIRDTRYLV